jgi:ParB family chromosome partitioning protein
MIKERKIRYKEVSKELQSLVAPNSGMSSRSSIGFEHKIGEYYYFDVENLIPYKNQTRQIFDEKELDELSETITKYGIRQPLTVIRSNEVQGSYEVVSGERRLRAAIKAGLKSLPCIILKDENNAEEIALIENVQRNDLHPVELGNAYYKLLSNGKHGSVSELAKKIGKPVSSISENSKLAELPNEIKQYLIDHNIRSRAILRNLTTAKNNDERERLLGIANKTQKILSTKSYFKVSYVDNQFILDRRLFNKLAQNEKRQLKHFLMELIQEL